MKKRLSSYLTPVWQVFPFIWLVATGSGLVGAGFGNKADFSLTKLIVAIFFWVLLSIFLIWLCLPLKTVIWDGAEILVSGFRKRFRLSLTEITEVSGPDWSSLSRIVIYTSSLKSANGKVVFAPKLLQSKEIREFIERELNKNRL